MTTELVELADCPFCGAAAKLDTDVFTTVIQCTNDQCISRCDMGGYNVHGHKQAAITAWNTRAIASRAGAPDGFVLVPAILTDEMVQAGHKAQWDVEPDGELHGDKTISLNAIYRRIYAAQIAAAPEPVAVG